MAGSEHLPLRLPTRRALDEEGRLVEEVVRKRAHALATPRSAWRSGARELLDHDGPPCDPVGVIAEPDRLRTLVHEYGKLRRLEGHTPQSRGQRFNGLIAEVFQSWGIDAHADFDARGNIDVAFSLDGTRYILEAKWEAEPADTGTIAKLQKRVRQRLGGTIGVVLAMSGFSPDAHHDLRDGERLEVLLIEREHFEAILTGLVPPQELVPLLLDRASFRGEVGVPLVALLTQDGPDLSGLRFGSPPELDNLVARAPSSFKASVAVSNLPFGQSGVAEKAADVLVLTLTGGLVEVNLREQSATTILPIDGCSRNVLLGADGSLYFVRKSGVGQLSGGELRVAGGALTGNVALVAGQDGAVYAFANSRGDGPDSRGALIARLGTQVGDEVFYPIDYPSACGMNASWLSTKELLVVGSAGVVVWETDGAAERLPYDLTNPMGLARLDGQRALAAEGEVSLVELNPAAKASREVARFNLQGSVSELAATASAGLGGYLFSHYTKSTGETKGVVVGFSH